LHGVPPAGRRLRDVRAEPGQLPLRPERAAALPKFYVLQADGSIGLQWDIDSAVPKRAPTQLIELTVSDGRLVGGIDFDVSTSSGIAFSFITRAVAGPLAEFRVWASIEELVASAGLVQVGVTSSDPEPFVTGLQARALFRIREDTRIAIPRQIVDDQERIWSVASYRLIGDRRFLEVEGFRTLQEAEDV